MITFPQPGAIFMLSSESTYPHSCCPMITFPQPEAIFMSSSESTCIPSHHLPIPLSQPKAIFTSSSESTCIQSHCQPITHSHLHPEIFTASSCLHSCLCIPAGAGCLHGGNYYRCVVGGKMV